MSHIEMANDVLYLMDELKISKVNLVGHSMGGKVAMALALAFPQRVSGLMILDIAPVSYTYRDPSWNSVKKIIDSLLLHVHLAPGKTRRELELDLRESVEDPAMRSFILTNLETTKGQEQQLKWKINIEAIASQLDNIAGFDVSDLENFGESPVYDGDTFIINGGMSPFVKGSHLPVISSYFPNYLLSTIRGAGHWVHAEAHDDTLALLKRYLDR